MSDKKKVPKSDANYRRGRPATNCGACRHFRRGLPGEEDTCTVVAGKIESNMVSDYFSRR